MKTKKEIGRFLMSGAMVNATDLGIYYLLFHFMSFSIAKGISFSCAGVVGYVFNKYWTFKQDRKSYSEAGRYVLINFLALGVNVVTNQTILNGWHHAVFFAAIIAAMVTGLLTFVCFKWWVF